MYEQCKVTAEALVAKQPGHTCHNLSLLEGRIPKCVRWIGRHENIKQGLGWNDVAMQLAAWFSVTEVDEKILQKAAESHQGTTGRKPEELGEDLRKKLGSGLEFECAAMNALFHPSPCGGCALNKPMQAPNWDAAASNDAESPDEVWPRQEWRPQSTTEAGDSDLGNACRLFDHAGRDLMFVSEVGWHCWNGWRWVQDEAAARRRADELPRLVLRDARDCLDIASRESDPDRRDKLTAKAGVLTKWARRCESSKMVEAAFGMLERRLVVNPSEVDCDPFLLAVGNGTVNLRTGALRASERGDFITRGSSVAFHPDATCPIFEGFLKRIFRQHLEVIPFLQRAIGYTLTGDTREQCLFLLHGGGANGKSTLINVLEQLLGDYAKQAAPDLLTARAGDRHPTEIADLRGSRLLATVETGEGRRLAENLVKQMTGGDKLKGRYMRRDFIEFMPEFKLWLASNHLPQIRGTDGGIWRRIRLIPFLETIADHEKDPTLPEKLQAEASGILAWAVRGCLDMAGRWSESTGGCYGRHGQLPAR
jgi:P4 family phage/plasmid primase-like protien